MALTDTWLKAHHKKPQEKAFEKADGDGLNHPGGGALVEGGDGSVASEELALHPRC